MKYYRKWWWFSRQRQRRRQQQIFIIIGLLTTSLLGFFLLNQVLSLDNIKITYLIRYASSSSINCHCSKSSLVIFNHGECFFNQPVCYPGFIGNQCEIQLKNEVYE